MSKVLITGSSGSIGRVLAPRLTALGHEVVGVDLAGAELTVDCTDPPAVDAAMGEVRPDAVIHLGASRPSRRCPTPSSHVNRPAPCSRRCGATTYPGLFRLQPRRRSDAAQRPAQRRRRRPPKTSYGVAKVAAESLLLLFVDRYGIDVVSTRIGSFGERPTTRRQLSTWLSPADSVRMFDAGLTAPSPGFAVIYGVWPTPGAGGDLASGGALGYEPQDDAESFAAEVESEPETETDRHEAAHVGGPFASGEFDRPAFD